VEFMAMLRAVAGVTLSANPDVAVAMTRANPIPNLQVFKFTVFSS
jgi:hypothetical protein